MPVGPVVGSGAPPTRIIFQAEAGTVSGGAIVSSDQPGYSGGGFVDFVEAAGETVSWTFDVAQTGRYAIGFRYALASVAGARPLEVLINGVETVVLPFAPTGGFGQWANQNAAVVLPAGTVTLTLATTGASGANLDYLAIRSSPQIVLNTPPTISGTGATVVLDAGGNVVTAIADLVVTDPDVADDPIVMAEMADGSALPDFLLFDAASWTITATASAAPGTYDVVLGASDGQATSSTTVALQVVVRAPPVVPNDLDADGIRNKVDGDDDNDGLLDTIDPFLADATNGRAARIDPGTSLLLDFTTAPVNAPAGWGYGLTGLLTNGIARPEARGLASPALRFLNGALHIEDARPGNPGPDTQVFGASFGIDPNASRVTITARFDNPYDTRVASAGEAFGLLIGTGDQDNYLRLVLRAESANSVSLRVEGENGGSPVAGYLGTYAAAGLAQADAGDTVRLSFEIDTVAGLLRPFWSVDTASGTVTGEGAEVAVTGALLAAVRGDATTAGQPTGLAIAITANSGSGTPLDVDVLDIRVEGGGSPDIEMFGVGTPFVTDRVVFNYLEEAKFRPKGETLFYKADGVVHIANTGESDLTISQLLLNGPFKFLDASDRGSHVLAAGQSMDVEIGFDRDAFVLPTRGTTEAFDGVLRVLSNDPDESVGTIDLAGWWQAQPGAGREPGLNDILEIYGFGNRVDMAKLQNGRYEQAAAEEVLAPYWQLAPGYSQVTVQQLAAFEGEGAVRLVIHAPTNDAAVVNLINPDTASVQSLLPLASNGVNDVVTFNKARVPDAWIGDDWFGFRIGGNSSDPTLNKTPAANGDIRGHFIRLFAAEYADGTALPDTYIMVVDLSGSNLDYNDAVYIVSGITPVTDLLLV